MKLKVFVWVLYRNEQDGGRTSGRWEYRDVIIPCSIGLPLSDEMVQSRALHALWQEHDNIERVLVDMYRIENE